MEIDPATLIAMMAAFVAAVLFLTPKGKKEEKVSFYFSRRCRGVRGRYVHQDVSRGLWEGFYVEDTLQSFFRSQQIHSSIRCSLASQLCHC